MTRSIAQAYHDLTKYDERNVLGGPGLDPSKQPRPFKEIVSSQRVSLRSHVPVKVTETGAHLEPVPPLAERPRLALPELSRLLFFTHGVTGLVRSPYGRQLLRAAPSAGALYPTEIYVAARDVDGLAPGLYNYQAPQHELVRLWDDAPLDGLADAAGIEPAFAETPALLLLTGLWWRSAWRYRERGYRRVLLDTGHVLANLLTYAATEGRAPRAHLGFRDAELNGLFFFDEAEEGALAAVSFPSDPGLGGPAPLWSSPTGDGRRLHAAPLEDEVELADSATVALHRASACLRESPVEARPEAPGTGNALPLTPPGTLGTDIARAILHRRSARGYAGGAVARTDLGGALGFAFGRMENAHAMRAATRADGLLRAHLVVTDVDTIAPGVYAVDGAGETLEPVSSGSFRDRLHHLALGQEIARLAAATLVLSAPAAQAVERWGERAYRYLHVEAGAIGQRFQLAAQALGLAACGIGGFFDDEACALVGIPADDWVLYLVTLGRS